MVRKLASKVWKACFQSLERMLPLDGTVVSDSFIRKRYGLLSRKRL
jgi:hypothetical protein